MPVVDLRATLEQIANRVTHQDQGYPSGASPDDASDRHGGPRKPSVPCACPCPAARASLCATALIATTGLVLAHLRWQKRLTVGS